MQHSNLVNYVKENCLNYYILPNPAVFEKSVCGLGSPKFVSYIVFHRGIAVSR